VKAKLFALLFLSLVAVLFAPSGCATTVQDQPDTGTPVEAGPPNPCGPGTAKQCNGVCVDVFNDTQNCGDCGTVCSSDKVCSHGSCAAVCGGGTAHCGNFCVDLKSDPLNCGGCGTKCPSGEVCNKAACALTCQDPLTDCNGGCVDTTSDDFNCGACGNVCPGGKSCVNSTCQATCQSGWSSCPDGTDAGTTCVDTTNDPNNCNGCGNKCPNGYFCNNGVCGIQCAGGTTKCGNACVDESIDKNNCGGCGTVCTSTYSCSNAHCCPPATPVYCGGCDTFTNCVTKSGGRISAGYEHTCAINSGGAVYCWGYNGSGQCGTGSTTVYEYNTAQAAQTLTSNTLMLAGGEDHACGVTGTGAAYCWGYNGYGQIGNGTTTSYIYSPAVVSGFSSGATRVAAGGYYATGILASSGAIKTTGYDYEGLLMLGSITFSQYNTPQASKITSGAINIGGGAGGYSMCAVTGGGSVQCWGYASYGLGDGSSTMSGTPITVSGITNAVSVSTGYYDICAVTAAGQLKCWGYGGYGGLGTGNTTTSSTPVTATLSGVIQACVGYGHTCALTSSGAVQCVGYNVYGALGNGSTSNSTTWVTPISSGAVGVTCGYYHTCALMSSGKAECWGYNYDGETGNGTYTTSYPYAVTSPAVVQGF
jgi:hypothetical protein